MTALSKFIIELDKIAEVLKNMRVKNSLNQNLFYTYEASTATAFSKKDQFKSFMYQSLKEPEAHLRELLFLFNNLMIKNTLKNQLCPLKLASFAAYWDGAKVIVNNFEREKDHRIKKADLNLLKEDLNKLATFF